MAPSAKRQVQRLPSGDGPGTPARMPDTSMKDFIEAEQAAERLRDGFADYFQKLDALVTPVLPLPTHKHGQAEFVINGQKVDATYLLGATVPLNITACRGSDAVRHEQGRPADLRPNRWQLAGRVDDPEHRVPARKRKPHAGPASGPLTTVRRPPLLCLRANVTKGLLGARSGCIRRWPIDTTWP